MSRLSVPTSRVGAADGARTRDYVRRNQNKHSRCPDLFKAFLEEETLAHSAPLQSYLYSRDECTAKGFGHGTLATLNTDTQSGV